MIATEQLNRMSVREISKMAYAMYHDAGKDQEKWREITAYFEYLMSRVDEDSLDYIAFADTLGYIYYYGRGFNWQPQYAEAFKYFTIAHEGGEPEGTYKLGDMYLNGYYVERDPEMAVRLYLQVWNKLEKDFQEEYFRGNFADIALRLGSLYRKGIGCEKDPARALFIFTMAEYAIRERMKESSFFGNKKVLSSIETELGELRAELGVDLTAQSVSGDFPQVLPMTVGEGARVFFEDMGGDRVRITAIIESEETRPCVLFSECGYVKFVDRVVEYADGVSRLEVPGAGAKGPYSEPSFVGGLWVNAVMYDPESEGYAFYDDDKKVALIKADQFTYELDR